MDFERLQALFHEAIERAPDARRAFLEEACAGDAALVEAVWELVEADAAAEDSFLMGGLVAEVGPVRLPEQLGAYRVIRELGRGGMGIVYEAEQAEPKRRVAVKVVRQAFATSELVARFEREAEVLARLRHPGIAHVYAAGSAEIDGERWPFFAMELIHGVPLDRHLDATEAPAPARLRMFAQVCDAIEHAHARGVVHRDLKPSNVLVDEDGQPKILDFGVARIVGADADARSLQTATGQVVGTIGYMSPEQLSGDPGAVDARSDIYALGVILFRLLTGGQPHAVQGRALPEVVRIVHDEEPTRLSSFDARWRGDLETIVGKALEREPSRRYASAAELAADVRRHLANEPILARPPSAVYRIERFARRNPGVVAGVFGTIFALALGLVISMIALAEASRERDAKNEALEVSEAVTRFLTHTLAQADPRRGGRERTVREALNTAAFRVDVDFATMPRVRAELRTTLGTTLYELGAYEEAEGQLRESVTLWSELSDGRRANTSRIRVAQALIFLGRVDEASTLAAEALATCRREDPEDSRTLLFALKVAGATALVAGRIDEASKYFDEGLMLLPTVETDAPQLALSFEANRMGLLLRTGQQERAIAVFERILPRYREVYGPEHPETLSVLGMAAMAERDVDPERAARRFEEVVTLQAEVLGEVHDERLIVLNQLARHLSKMGRRDEAMRWIEGGIEVARAQRPQGVPHYLWFALATIQADAGHPEADATFERALSRVEEEEGSNSDGSIRLRTTIARRHLERGRWAEAETTIGPLIEAIEATREPGSAAWIQAQLMRVRARAGARRFAEAAAVLEGLKERAPPAERGAVEAAAVELYEAWGRTDDVARWRRWAARGP